MGFYNDCCRGMFKAAAMYKDPATGDELTCGLCVNAFIFDGERWRNVHEIGQRKVEKYRRIAKTETTISSDPTLRAMFS